MTRFSTITAIFLTGAFATLLVNLNAPSQTPLLPFNESALSDETREMLIAYQSFKGTLSATLESLERGEIDLREARDRVYEMALHCNLRYLHHIANSERGSTPQERVARNLIGHLSVLRGSRPALAVRLRALDLELAALYPQEPAMQNH